MDEGSSSVKLGLRVVRGPDWSYGEDALEGLVGTVVEIGGQSGSIAPVKSVAVVWDTGVKGYYRTGCENVYDLHTFDNIQCGVFHLPTCNGCKEKGIAGFKWKCSLCYGVLLCTSCYMSDKHDTTHPFIRYQTVLSYGVAVSPRCVSLNERRLAKGIFKGASVLRGQDWNAGNRDGGGGDTGQVVNVSKWGEYTVRWMSGASFTYRIGKEGKVDLKLAGPAYGGNYYKSHLPIVGKLDDDQFEEDFALSLQISDHLSESSDNSKCSKTTDHKNLVPGYRDKGRKKKTGKPTAANSQAQEHTSYKRSYVRKEKLFNLDGRDGKVRRDGHSDVVAEANDQPAEETALLREGAKVKISIQLSKLILPQEGHWGISNDMIQTDADSSKVTTLQGPTMERQRSTNFKVECTICLSEEASAAFVPCGHVASCPKCVKRFVKCPICRSKIESVLHIFIP